MTTSVTTTAGRVAWLGANVDYQQAWDLQRRIASQRAKDEVADTLLLLEHAAVYLRRARVALIDVIVQRADAGFDEGAATAGDRRG